MIRPKEKEDLKEKYSFLLRPWHKNYVISPFIPKNLVYFSSPRKKEKSPLRVVEVYAKENPENSRMSKDSKYFKSISPKLISFISPAKLSKKLSKPLQGFYRKSEIMHSKLRLPSKLPKIREKASKTPDPCLKHSPKSSSSSSQDLDKLSIYLKIFKYSEFLSFHNTSLYL
jgi:hypothetical protein